MSVKRIQIQIARLAPICLIGVLGYCGYGCQASVNTVAPPTGETVSFSAQIQPIFDNTCTTCHQEGGIADLVGIGVRLIEGESFAMLIDQPSTQREDLTLVVPGDSSASLLFIKVSSNSPLVGARMPLIGPPLSSTEIGLIRDWIDQGAPDN